MGSPLVLIMGWKAIRSKKTTDYKKFYWGSLLLAIVASIAYFTGPSTADWVKEHIAIYSKELVENHALCGRFGFTSSILSGVLSIMAIANYAQKEKPHKAIPWMVFFIILLNILIFSYTAHLGGLIRRPDLV